MATRTVQADPQKLDTLRISHGLSLEGFAARAGLSKRTLENIMAGKPMLVGTAKCIADQLKVPITAFLAGAAPASGPTERRFDIHVRLAIDFEEFDETKEGLDLADRLNAEGIRAESKEPGKTTVTIEMTASTIRSLAEHFPLLNINPEGFFSLVEGALLGTHQYAAPIPDRQSILDYVDAIEFPDIPDFPCAEWRGVTYRHRYY